jgi:Amt family ammonium transporter
MEEIKFALDTFYAVMAGALVMWMAAGFTMLEAGLVQKKNVAEIVTKNLGLYSIACIMYLVCGFVLMYPAGSAFGLDGILPAIGTSVGLSTSMDPAEIGLLYGSEGSIEGGDFVGYYSQQADFFFQVVFVATAMSIVSGAVAGRMKIMPFFLFAVVLTGFIYPIQGYWNWGGGFLSEGGYSDYAGSGTVHLCGAAAALAVVLALGPRNGKYANGQVNAIPGSNIPLAALGVWILWMGWFGFNGGSELKVSEVDSAVAVSQVFLNTNLAAAGGVVGAIVVSYVLGGNKIDVTMAINGAIAGLVAITAGPSAPSAGAATLIGLVGGILVYFSILLLDRKLKIDDPVGAISAHGIVGIFGVLVVPLTADVEFGAQLKGVLAIGGFTFITSFIAIKVINIFLPIRATDEEQEIGLDVAEIGVEAYPEFK